jgi:hypothetical protein
MKTDNPTAWCVSFPADDLDRIRAEATHEGLDVEDWIRQAVWERLQVKHVERSDDDDNALIPPRASYQARGRIRNVRQGKPLADPDDEETERSDGARSEGTDLSSEGSDGAQIAASASRIVQEQER